MPASQLLKKREFTFVSLLTLFALAVHGYHPFAEDGGVYVAEIKQRLHPALYPHAAFVTEHLRLSIFTSLVAGLTRLSHLSLDWVLFALYLFSIWTTLYAASLVAARATTSLAGRRAGVALLACWLTLPIAGTSLMLFDPYLTARSFTTPLILAAIAGALDAVSHQPSRARSLMPAALIAAALLHPLMAAYGAAAILLIAGCSIQSLRTRRWAITLATILIFLIAGAIQILAPHESPDYLAVERTRYYWFLSEWRCYEILGLIAPMVLLCYFAARRAPAGSNLIARGTLALGLISSAICVAFAHLGYATHLVARLQPLRCFQFVYIAMILLLGIQLGERLLEGKPWRWGWMPLLAIPLFFAGRITYPSSAHIELPDRTPPNYWQQAFLWIRSNTPNNALFALNPHYIQVSGEDAQSFRAIAERNALPDYSKDGGVASIMPALADAWVSGQIAQASIDSESDAQRALALKPLGVTWVILSAESVTLWHCPYRNIAAKVCILP